MYTFCSRFARCSCGGWWCWPLLTSVAHFGIASGPFSATAAPADSVRQSIAPKRRCPMDDDLEEEREGILKRLFDVFFHGQESTKEEVDRDAHRLGTINRRLREE